MAASTVADDKKGGESGVKKHHGWEKGHHKGWAKDGEHKGVERQMGGTRK
jgi:hypothetical protein